jgi:ribosomal protein L7/L12
LEAGDTPDDVARLPIEREHLDPIPAIKAMRAGGGISLGEAKEIVHRNLPVERQRATEKLWNEAIAVLEADEDDRP